MRIQFYKNDEKQYSRVMRDIVEDYVRDVKSYLYGAKVIRKNSKQEGRIISVVPGLSTTEMVFYVEFSLNGPPQLFTLKGIEFV